MCVVSNIGDYYRTHKPEWPDFGKGVPMPTYPLPPQWPKPQDLDAMRKFRELVKKAEEADEAAGEKDCEKPEVKDYIKQVLERLDAIEKRLTELEAAKPKRKRTASPYEPQRLPGK